MTLPFQPCGRLRPLGHSDVAERPNRAQGQSWGGCKEKDLSFFAKGQVLVTCGATFVDFPWKAPL